MTMTERKFLNAFKGMTFPVGKTVADVMAEIDAEVEAEGTFPCCTIPDGVEPNGRRFRGTFDKRFMIFDTEAEAQAWVFYKVYNPYVTWADVYAVLFPQSKEV